MAQTAEIKCVAEPDDRVTLNEGDIIVFVQTSDKRGVFTYEKSATSSYTNGFLVAVLKDNDIVPMALSLSSILAPYGCEKPYCTKDSKNLNKGFDTLCKRTYNLILNKKVKVNHTTTVQFTTKKGDKYDWTCVELNEIGGKNNIFTPNSAQIEQLDNFVAEYIERQTKKLKG